MPSVQPKSIYASVRPARLAILLDNSDPDWQHTCERVIECLSATWGGQHSIIVPTDGKVISPAFWTVLESFDPDYICRYCKTGLDWKLSNPDQFRAYIDRVLTLDAEKTPSAEWRKAHEIALEGAHLEPNLAVEGALQLELKNRLAPFHFDDSLLTFTSLSASAALTYPTTPMSAVLPNIGHPKVCNVVDCKVMDVPRLWVKSVTGATFSSTTWTLDQNEIGINSIPFDGGALYGLFSLLMPVDRNAFGSTVRSSDGQNTTPAELLRSSPFGFSMLGTVRYQSIHARKTEFPAIVVVGESLLDFALYFDLSRMRRNVFWLPSSWLSDWGNESALPEPASVRRRLTERFATQLVTGLTFGAFDNIALISNSIDRKGLDDAKTRLDEAAGSAPVRPSLRPSFAVSADVREPLGPFLKSILINPDVVFNEDNLMLPTTLQFLEETGVGSFPTPKPKGFSEIPPDKHRWITELRIDGHRYPRHPNLGTWLLRHPVLSTQEARVGAYGLCYSSTGPAYFSGDVDTNLVRPELHVPAAITVFKRLAESKGWTSQLSDKGYYAADTISKFGGLQATAAAFRDPVQSSLLNAYTAENSGKQSKGRYLASDRRRYLDLAVIDEITGTPEKAEDLLDQFIDRRILHRGLVLKCDYCRSTDWFPLVDLSDEFTCKRCRNRQRILSRHALKRTEPAWYYQLDEIVYQGLRNDMQVPILALDYMRRNSESFLYADELELWMPSSLKPFIEVDLCCICDGVLTIGEAKTTTRIEKGGGDEAKALQKYKEAAELLGARRFVYATSDTWGSQTHKNVQHIFRNTQIDVLPLTGNELFA